VTEIRLTRSTLRPFRSGDEPSLARHANNRKLWLNLRDVFPHPYTEGHAAAWVRFNQQSPRWLNAAIVVDGEVAGGIGLIPQQDVMRHSAEIGYWLGEPFWNRGIVTEALVAFTHYGFDTLGFERLFAHVFGPNARSIRVLEKAGYTLEGRLRQAVVKDGVRLDMLVYGRLASERERSRGSPDDR
jgi:RimJ/RimL family protein N-acetyltransferase